MNFHIYSPGCRYDSAASNGVTLQPREWPTAPAKALSANALSDSTDTWRQPINTLDVRGVNSEKIVFFGAPPGGGVFCGPTSTKPDHAHTTIWPPAQRTQASSRY